MRIPWPTLLVGTLALGASATLSIQNASDPARAFDVVRVPRGDVMRHLALGQRGVVSDLYWLAAVQYIGENQKRADARGWGMLYPLIDLVTDLDPRHGYAYQTGGIVLSSVGRLDESDAILEKGIVRGPNWWTYPYYVAFNYWFYRGDVATAATWAERAARTPGASPNISQLAVALRAKSGSPGLVIPILEQLRDAARDPAIAERLEEQLRLAILERDAQSLERAAREYASRTGRSIEALSDLVHAGLIPALPRDPFGGHYRWDPEAQEVRSSANPFRFRLRQGAHPPKPQVDSARPTP